jgi:hypothetical protein
MLIVRPFIAKLLWDFWQRVNGAEVRRSGGIRVPRASGRDWGAGAFVQ